MKKKVFGILLLMEGLFLFLSTSVAFFYGESDVKPLLYTTLICMAVGMVLLMMGWKRRQKLTRKDCYIIISGIWVLFSIFGMLPFLFYGTTDSVSDAFFETMSGFTTTGASVLNNIDEQPHGLLCWRSILQWMGGLGIVIFSIALLPSFSRNNKQLFSTEATSVSTSKLRPKTQETARGIFYMYIGLTFLCTLFYWMGPMSFYDSVCHAMTTIGTGGFSTHQASIAYFNSPYLEYVCSIFTFLGGVNFALYYFASMGNWRLFAKNEEFRWYLVITVSFTILFFALFVIDPNHSPEHLLDGQYPMTVEEQLRTAFFHTTTILTSCGFQSTYCDYCVWGASFWMPTIMMMVCGACAGSSSGGVKVVRFMICLKNTRNEFLLHKHPNAVFPVKISKRMVDPVTVNRTLAFMFILLIVFIIGSLLLMFAGMDFDTAVGSCISALGNTGPGFGTTGPASNFSSVSDAAKWILSALMLIGRLEIYTVLLIFTRSFWLD